MEGATASEISWFTIYIVLLMTAAQGMLLALILLLAHKINLLVKKMEEVSQNAGKFVQMGMHFFKTHK